MRVQFSSLANLWSKLRREALGNSQNFFGQFARHRESCREHLLSPKMSTTDLNAISKDRDERFVRLFAHSEPSLRLFLRSLLPTWEDTDEVLQETSLVLWRKFDSFSEGTDFLRWACMVARFEALKYRRGKARDRHVFSEDMMELLAEEAVEELPDLERERKALEVCLERLGARERSWVENVYGSNLHIRDVAERSGRSAGSLYKALHRIRLGLLECVSRSLPASEPA